MLAVQKGKKKVIEIPVGDVARSFILNEVTKNLSNLAEKITHFQEVITLPTGEPYPDSVRKHLFGCKRMPPDLDIAKKRVYELFMEVTSSNVN